MDIYRQLKGGDLINFHLAFPQSTSELAPFLKLNLKYPAASLWPMIHLNTVPDPIEEDLIHAAYNLNLRLNVGDLGSLIGMSDGLRCKVTEVDICEEDIQGRLIIFQLRI